MMRRLLPFLFLLMPSLAHAQLGSVQYVATPGALILSAEYNANLSYIHSNALNRTGGTMTGSLTTQAILAASNNTYDIGSSGTRFATIYGTTGNFTTVSLTTLTCTGCVGTTQAAALDAGDTTTGTFADARLSANVPLLNAANTFTNASGQTFGPNTGNAIITLGSHGSVFTRQTYNYTSGTFVTDVTTGSSALAYYEWKADGTTRLSMTGAGLLTVSGIGTHAFTGGANSSQLLDLINTTSGTGAAVVFRAQAGSNVGGLYTQSQGYTTSAPFTQSGVTVYAGGAGGLNLAAVDGSGPIRFYAGGTTQRFGINSSGDWLRGTNIMDSVGTPTIGSGFGTGGPAIAGNDYAFKVTTGSGSSTSGVVNFGRTWTTAPVCSLVTDALGSVAISSITTTAVSLTFPAMVSGQVWVLCRGF